MSSTVAIPNRLPATTAELNTVHLREFFEYHLGCRMVFEGRLDVELLQTALRLSLDAEPVLGSVLRPSAFGGHWLRLADVSERAILTYLEAPQPDEDCASFYAQPLHPEGPRIAAIVLRAPDVDHLCLKIDHQVADGQGSKEFAYLVASIYSRLSEEPSYAPEPNLLARPSWEDGWRALSPEQRRQANTMPKIDFKGWNPSFAPGEGEGPREFTLRLEPDRLCAIKGHGIERGASVNDMLLAAYFRAIAAVMQPPVGARVPFSFTVDLRRFLPPGQGRRIMVMPNSLWACLEVVEDETFDATLRRVVDMTGRHRESLWGMKLVKQLPQWLAALTYTPRTWSMRAIFRMVARSAGSISSLMNIGRYDDDRLSFDSLAPAAVYSLGPPLKGAGLALTASTYRDALTLWICAREEHIDPQTIRRLLEVMDVELSPM